VTGAEFVDLCVKSGDPVGWSRIQTELPSDARKRKLATSQFLSLQSAAVLRIAATDRKEATVV